MRDEVMFFWVSLFIGIALSITGFSLLGLELTGYDFFAPYVLIVGGFPLLCYSFMMGIYLLIEKPRNMKDKSSGGKDE